MKIAPSCRKHLNNDKKMFLDKCINQCEDCEDILYLSLLKTGKYEPSKSERTWPVYIEDDDDVIIIGMFIYYQIFYSIKNMFKYEKV